MIRTIITVALLTMASSRSEPAVQNNDGGFRFAQSDFEVVFPPGMPPPGESAVEVEATTVHRYRSQTPSLDCAVIRYDLPAEPATPSSALGISIRNIVERIVPMDTMETSVGSLSGVTGLRFVGAKFSPDLPAVHMRGEARLTGRRVYVLIATRPQREALKDRVVTDFLDSFVFLPSKTTEKEDLELRRAAIRGDGLAAYKLSQLYQNRPSEGDKREWAYWLVKAADAGYVEAQLALGRSYDEREPAKAASWYQKAAEQGDAGAQNAMGDFRRLGRGVPRDDAKACQWFAQAAEQGLAEAEYNLAGCYLRGEGVASDAERAAALYSKAAAKGITEAYFYLGTLYDRGHGVSRDAQRAVALYRIAAEQGVPAAQHDLAEAFEYGRGVAQNIQYAVHWRRKAAEQGLREAQFDLGRYYELGIGVAKDVREAAAWYTKSAEQGYARAQLNLGSLCASGKGVVKNDAEAMRWYQKAAEQGNAIAEYDLGVMYLQQPVADTARARLWLSKAAAHGVTEANALLKSLGAQ